MGGSEIRELFPAILLGRGILAFMGMLPIQPKDVMLILERTYMPTMCTVWSGGITKYLGVSDFRTQTDAQPWNQPQ